MELTLNEQQIRALDQAKFNLAELERCLNGVATSQIIRKIGDVADLLDKILSPIDINGEDEFDSKVSYLDDIAKRHGFKSSVWSIYDIDDVEHASGLSGKQLIYRDHWGEEVKVGLPSGELTWLQLWDAANFAIKTSKDGHHIYIEAFKKKGKNLELITGS